jgi:hypothetical protein
VKAFVLWDFVARLQSSVFCSFVDRIPHNFQQFLSAYRRIPAHRVPSVLFGTTVLRMVSLCERSEKNMFVIKKITPVRQTVSREKKNFRCENKNLHVKIKQSHMKKKLFSRTEEVKTRKFFLRVNEKSTSEIEIITDEIFFSSAMFFCARHLPFRYSKSTAC